MTRNLHVDGKPVSLSHLDPIVRKVQLELRGNIKKVVSVEFRFSCHCYSRGLVDGEVAPAGHEVPDGSVHKPRPRVFDQERYTLSLSLVAAIDELIAANGIVTKSRQENFYKVDTVDTLRDGTTVTVSYFIFMHARKVQPPGKPKSVLVIVESAYPERDNIPHPAGRGSRSFGSMLGEAWG